MPCYYQIEILVYIDIDSPVPRKSLSLSFKIRNKIFYSFLLCSVHDVYRLFKAAL